MTESLQASAHAVAKAKSDWLDSQMKRLMPEDVYALSKTEKSRDRMKLAKWLVQNKVLTKENEPNQDLYVTALFRGEDLVSTFSVRVKDGKYETQVKDLEVINP